METWVRPREPKATRQVGTVTPHDGRDKRGDRDFCLLISRLSGFPRETVGLRGL